MPECLIVSGRRAPHIVSNTQPVHRASDEEFLEKLATLNGTPDEVLANPELLRLLMPSLRADFQLSETYRFVESRPLSCSITAIGGTHDPETHEGELDAWSRHTTSDFASHTINGGHFFIESNQGALISVVRTTLNRILR